MRFSPFKEFKNWNYQESLKDVINYLTIDVKNILKELTTGLVNLRLTENFNAFTVTVTIPAGQEQSIRNQMRSRIPTQRILVRGNSSSIVDGDTEWNMNYLYMKNTGLTEATVTLIFME